VIFGDADHHVRSPHLLYFFPLLQGQGALFAGPVLP